MKHDAPAAALYSSLVMHQRMFTVAYRFRYRVFSVLLDIDRLDEIAQSTWLFSRNRFNLFGFHDRDHLDGGHTDLRAWAEQVLAPYGIEGRLLRIRLLCFPRILGMVFNPLSLWYCETPEGLPVAVIAEVRNTFGERHCYLLQPAPGHTGWPLRDDHAKEFHVSPFIDMQGRYAFRLSQPDERLAVMIREYSADRLMLVASQTGRRKPFTSWGLLREALRVPFQTLKVISAIHWQALKIWLRGAKFHSKPAAPLKEVS
jgi:DUF1365 family protein